ncbi:hypothetical protein Ddye_010153 [Dipteronia dyeriana]|uniref:Uncharacterized protein n=1 Tax=Dipteronia dyeriana TaxID=168575 RepID=A0AAE0CN03_9ROSI|nr:hypothetical protein Ddye_010153 [Dipteronia dyeriana]
MIKNRLEKKRRKKEDILGGCNRLQKELRERQVNPPSGFKHKVTDNLQRCIVSLSLKNPNFTRLLYSFIGDDHHVIVSLLLTVRKTRPAFRFGRSSISMDPDGIEPFPQPNRHAVS